MKNILDTITSYITANNIALLSVIITVIIFVAGRHEEIRYKKHDDKKTQYLKLIKLMEDSFTSTKKNKKGELILSQDIKKQFFDTGSSLLLYGSKKIYRQYLLFREFTSNPLIKCCKYYKDSIIIYIMSEILVTMRKEVGLSYFNSIKNNEALAFFVNDISSNPIAKETSIDAKFRIKMIRFELAVIDRTKFIYLKAMYKKLIKPVFAGVSILFKYTVQIPFGKILLMLFPQLYNVAEEHDNDGNA